MNVAEYAATVLATAAGGFDPAPMVIMAAALGAGLRRRHVVGASALLLGGTVLLGLGLTLLVGPVLQSVDWWGLVRHGAVAAWVELALGVAIGVFAAMRAVSRRRGTAPEEEKPPARNAWALYVTALVFVGIVVFDPPFDIHVAVAAAQPLPVMVLGWVAWALISQIALTLLLLLTVLGRQERFSAVMQRAWARISPWVGVAVTVLLGLAALFLVLDAGRFLLLGHFLVG
ncbi:hypothetical protein EAE32_01445 [Kocuria tytonicola]|uniref:GAP family protein n=1 Tax=Kocuria tytonicola TaxID=2055946 RepID=A0A3L9L4K3_9MICC|nr:hypothetical protein [Kocuria tytonicola]RLY93936.1 hypothetical protein EAE32_01445 [Kocuria tytonicola]